MGTFTDAKEAFSDLDILVLPSLCKETFSLAAHEAFAANIPVIAPAIGAFPDYIQDNYNSLLFVPGCKESLMEKMRLLINRPDLIETYKNNMFQPKTLEEHVQSIIEAYQKQTKING